MSSRSSCCSPNLNRGLPLAPHDASSVFESAQTMLGRCVVMAGGSFLMGTNYQEGFPGDGEGPIRPVTLSPFGIDRVPVTNDVFHSFVTQSGYITDAERCGWSFVFKPDGVIADDTDRVHQAPWWRRVQDACWKNPEGPRSTLEGRMDHPVVHVSWNDAQAFCCWSGQRLPTEAEWEYAARGGLEQKLFPWGNVLVPDGRHLCNVWQGSFPSENTAEDGYAGTCPVMAFPPNCFGLFSMVGNTWEWCADRYTTNHETLLNRNNPKGPVSGTTRVLKGGSFLCHASYCNRYRTAARSSNSPDSAASNIGFRCAVDLNGLENELNLRQSLTHDSEEACR